MNTWMLIILISTIDSNYDSAVTIQNLDRATCITLLSNEQSKEFIKSSPYITKVRTTCVPENEIYTVGENK